MMNNEWKDEIKGLLNFELFACEADDVHHRKTQEAKSLNSEKHNSVRDFFFFLLK